jgi:pimeloyl-ACP methyl ester carboxylesterase
MEITVRDIEANGWRFHCREAGGSGEPVILLHGFPETSRMWEPLMVTLAAEGYRCVAPDQRGYSPGARPQEADAYRYADLAADVLELARVLGFQRFHLVGHDWGAAAGWAVLLACGYDRLPYVTTKHAIVGMSESLALYLRPRGIGVTCLCPSGVNTNIVEQMTFLGSPSTPRSPDYPVVEAEIVGELVADVVADGRFLVLTVPEVHDEMVERAADIDAYLTKLNQDEHR